MQCTLVLLAHFVILTQEIKNSEKLELLILHTDNIFASIQEVDHPKTHTLSANDTHIFYLDVNSNSIKSKFLQQEWVTNFISRLKSDAIKQEAQNLGKKLDDLLNFLVSITCPILIINRAIKDDDKINQYLVLSHVFAIENHKIGVIGFKTFNSPKFNSESDNRQLTMLKRECFKLNELNANIIIALGQSSKAGAQGIFDVEPIDIIIDGQGEFWVKFHRIFQQTPFERSESLKYLGVLMLKFNEFGDVERCDDRSIVLSHVGGKVSKRSTQFLWKEIDKRLRKADNEQEQQNEKESAEVIELMAELDRNCDKSECNFGNLVADAMCFYGKRNLTKSKKIWSEYPIAMFLGDFKENIPKGIIKASSFNDSILETGKLIETSMKGTAIKKALMDYYTKGPKVIQISGIHVRFLAGSDKTSLTVLCGDCEWPKYEKLDEGDRIYNVLVNDRLQEELKSVQKPNSPTPDIITLVQEYAIEKKMLFTSEEDRYLIVNKAEDRHFTTRSGQTKMKRSACAPPCLKPVALLVVASLLIQLCG